MGVRQRHLRRRTSLKAAQGGAIIVWRWFPASIHFSPAVSQSSPSTVVSLSWYCEGYPIVPAMHAPVRCSELIQTRLNHGREQDVAMDYTRRQTISSSNPYIRFRAVLTLRILTSEASLELLANTEQKVVFKVYRDKWQQEIETVFRSRVCGVCNVSTPPAAGLESSRFSAVVPRQLSCRAEDHTTNKCYSYALRSSDIMITVPTSGNQGESDHVRAHP